MEVRGEVVYVVTWKLVEFVEFREADVKVVLSHADGQACLLVCLLCFACLFACLLCLFLERRLSYRELTVL